MLADFHFLRSWSFLLLIPLGIVFWQLRQMSYQLQSWSAVCDEQLLAELVRHGGKTKRHYALSIVLMSIFWVVFSLAGPTWSKYPVPSYTPIMPRVVVLDMSDAMLVRDLTPDRLTRAKFKLHDLFSAVDTKKLGLGATAGQFGFVIFTSEPFVVSPLTDDAKTIDSLLESVSPGIMPVNGYRLDLALKEAANLIQQSGFKQGQLLVLTAATPNQAAINMASNLASLGIITSVMPIRSPGNSNNALFEHLASAGDGTVLAFSDNSANLAAWLKQGKMSQHLQFSQRDDIPVWRDEGRWFLIPALIFMLPVFRRGWLQRVVS
ncbi:MAG: hypothetical protein A3F46_03480 [Legionellales bacterium RIFCSPHIGHO2_12_FULL_42_9]|nr:MAG: hypothetical protein A3F46_03480 [Legionellales bacterium RIFCSPHIGHO2_12_FULL_42_9]